MVKVAIAGANSAVSLEVIDELVRDGKHEVLALCRRDPAQFPQQAGVNWVQTSFEDKAELASLLKGSEVVLSFLVINDDPENHVNKRILDAAIEAGVKRFAPSEWAMGQKLHDVVEKVPWYKSKIAMQKYLRDINKDRKVIEYCFFQPGSFAEYLASPHRMTRHIPAMNFVFSLPERRAVAVKGYEDQHLTFTTVKDVVTVVRRAIEYEGAWPEVGGITGFSINAREFKDLAEKISGKEFRMDISDYAKLAEGVVDVDMPKLEHPSIPPEQREVVHDFMWSGILTALAKGAWDTTDEWNKLLPDYKFTTAEEFINEYYQKFE